MGKKLTLANIFNLSKELKCPKCKIEINIKNDFTNESIYMIKCNKCSNVITMFKCINCSCYININIKNERLKSNSIIECKSCKKSMCFLICSLASCDEAFLSNRISPGYEHECEKCNTRFSQLNCAKCNQTCSFITATSNFISIKEFNDSGHSTENPTMSKYIPGQLINCTNCKHIFSVTYCLNCEFPHYSENKKPQIGEITKCLKCSENSSILFCLFCNRRLHYKVNKKYIDGSKLTCPYSDCSKCFYLIKCHKCFRYNYFIKYRILQPVTCKYEDCQIDLSIFICEICGFGKIFKPGELKYGCKYKCLNCEESCTYTTCSCGDYKVLKTSDQSVKMSRCENCAKVYYNRYCAHCNRLLMLNGEKYQLGMTLICPYEDCEKKFNNIHCVKCGLIINFKDSEEYFEGKAINCKDCNNWTHIVNCSVCSKTITFNQTHSKYCKYLFGELTCVHSDCGSNFYISDVHKKVYKPSPVEFSKSRIINFPQPESLFKRLSDKYLLK